LKLGSKHLFFYFSNRNLNPIGKKQTLFATLDLFECGSWLMCRPNLWCGYWENL